MKIIHCLLLACSMMLVPAILWAQQKKSLNGIVRDLQQKPVASATVHLLSVKDSSLVKVFLTADNGSFLFEGIAAGTYRLNITAIGFEPLTTDSLVIEEGTGNKILPALVLKTASATTMNAVTVTARKPFVERKIDRTVVNVDALISNAGTNALEVLDKAPGIFVDQDGNISMNGKPGVVIYLDDKPTYLSGSDLAAYLKSLPSGTLETIELMPNPPARYDAAGKSGIINIRTKKGKQKGFNGNISPSYSQGRYPKTFNSLNLNFRDNKFNYYLNGGINYSKNFNDLLIERQYVHDDGSPDYLFSQNTWIIREDRSGSLRAGMDYSMNKQTSLGIVFSGNIRRGNNHTDNNSYLFNDVNQLDSVITADNRDHRKFNRSTAGLTLRHKFQQPGRELAIDLDYIYNKSASDQHFRNASFFADNTPKEKDELTGNLPSSINIYGFKTDYTHPLAEAIKLEAGIKTNYIKTNNQALYFTTVNGVTNPDYDKTNHFLYTENINAGYLNFSRDAKHISVQAGLRAENTIMKGHQLGNALKPDSAFKRNYTNLFPTIYLSWKPDTASKHQFVLSYSKRIQRPGFGDLNPFISPLDKFTYYVGNPYLQPTISHSIELAHTFKQKITTTLSYENYNGDFGETIYLQGTQYYSQPANTGRSYYWLLMVNASLDPAPWWTVNLFAMTHYAHFKQQLYSTRVDTGGINYSGNFTSQFRLGKGWTLECSGRYQSRWITNQFVLGDWYTFNGGIQKKILKDKGSVKLTLQDIFYTRLNYGDINNLQNAHGRYRNKGDFRVLGINFTYNFGKSFETRKRVNGSADAEQQRI